MRHFPNLPIMNNTSEPKEVLIFGQWVSLREAKKILNEIQLPQVPGGSHFTNGDTNAHTCGWTSCDAYTCGSGQSCNSTCAAQSCSPSPCASCSGQC